MEDQFRNARDTASLRGDVVVLLFADRNGAEAAHEVGKRLHVHFHPGAAKAEGPIALDGKLDEASWASAPLATHFVQNDPREGDNYTFVGVSSRGTPVWLHKEVAKRDVKITIGQAQANHWGAGGGGKPRRSARRFRGDEYPAVGLDREGTVVVVVV